MPTHAVVAVALLLCNAARAQEPEAGSRGDVVEYRFEDEWVGGDRMNPNGEVLQVRRKGDRGSLIRVREHFVDRLLKSVEAL